MPRHTRRLNIEANPITDAITVLDEYDKTYINEKAVGLHTLSFVASDNKVWELTHQLTSGKTELRHTAVDGEYALLIQDPADTADSIRQILGSHPAQALFDMVPCVGLDPELGGQR